MYFLSFETSTKIFSLALNKDAKVLRFRNIKSAMVLEDAIIPAIDKMLDAAGISFDQVDGFAIALGPGSFTSLRVGLSTIKAFAMSTNKPVVGIPSMDIIARGVCHSRASGNPLKEFIQYDQICVLNDARQGKVYACLYGPQGATSEYLLTTLDDVLDKVHGNTIFVGDALGIYRKDIEKAYQKHSLKKGNACKCLFADEKWWYPQSKVMAQLVYERFQAKKFDDAAKLLPLYLYPQDCQVTPPVAGSSPNVSVGDLKKIHHGC